MIQVSPKAIRVLRKALAERPDRALRIYVAGFG